MTENKRFKLRIHPKDNGVKIFDEQADDGYRRLFDVSYVDYESAKQLRARLEPVVNLLNELSDENEQLKQDIIKIEEVSDKRYEENQKLRKMYYTKF